ncbi:MULTISPECIES: RodZ family helix-turn-helix domain-containing protein [Allobacillus]|uniref:Helix-turn-helix domain-containing protein n=1 Tax=Allobacillus salarius TaxID=1955272 RepID=A0A556PS52_9BACI|nr:helix-turn-helix domain-containing protein [Allobacillus salarius]TSJ67215.1 helix-turn-helix domain-containing protein [Allobacillus salarius]
MEIGKRLREERLNQGLSLEEVKSETKIQTRYLTAVEENDWSKMPGNFYVRAFIREYAEVLGMDAAMLLEEHKNELPQTSDVSYDYVSTPSRKESRSGNIAFFSFLPKLLVFLLVIGIIFGIWYSYVNFVHPALTENDEQSGSEEGSEIIAPDVDEEESNEEEEATDGDKASEQSEGGNEEQSEEKIQPSLSVEEVDEDAATPLTTVRLTDAESLELEFEIDGETYLWVHGIEDGEVVESFADERVYTSDDSPLTIEASGSNDFVELNIGRASVVNLKISGTEFEYPIDANEEVHQKIHILWEPSES